MIAAAIERLVATGVAHPRRTAALALAIMAAGLALGSRLQLADDARALISGGDYELERHFSALSQFTAVDQLLLMVDGRGGSADLDAAAARLVEHLTASGAFERAWYTIDARAPLELVEALTPRRWLVDPRDVREVLEPQRLARRMVELREILLSPTAIVSKPFLIGDPLGSLEAALAGFSSAPGLPRLDPSSGRLASADGTSLLVLAVPKGDPFAGSDARRSMVVVEEARALLAAEFPGIVLRPLGAHRYTRDAEGMVRGDVHFSVVTSLLGVLVLFITFFRRPALAFVAVPALAFGACFALGIAGLLGTPVHAIVLAFAAACLGLSIDYSVHLVATTAVCGEDVRQALPIAARRIGPSLSMVMTTTIAGLLALELAHMTALRQMGLLAMAAVFGAFLGTLLWVPVILPRVVRTAPLPPLMRGPWTAAVSFATRRPWLVIVTAVALALPLAWLARLAKLDGDLHNLDTHTLEAVADEGAFTAAYGDPAASALALVEAPTTDAALDGAAKVADAIARAGVQRILSPTLLAPPLRVLEARRAAWCDPGLDAAGRVETAATAAGFAPGAFAAFARDLAHLCSAPFGELADPGPALAAFGKLVGQPVIHTSDEGVRVAVAFAAPDEELGRAGDAVTAAGALFVHRSSLNRRVIELVAADLPRLGIVSFALVVLLLIGSFRNLVQPLRALAPCVLALLTTFAVMALTDTPVNLMNLCVLPLLAGIGIDYGVLMADVDRDPSEHATAERAFSVSVAALTTLADFGTLALADYYALATIGRIVLLAVGSAALYALFLPPALAALRRTSTRPPPRG